MKSVLIIGIGRFGTHLIKKFHELGDQVMAVDIDELKVQKIIPFVTSAKIGDCTEEETVMNLGIKNFDLCYVCMGKNFQSSLEITNLLKEKGAARVISKAGTEVHAKFLMKVGADEVAYPEKDSAYKLAVRHSADNIFDFIELAKDVLIYEIPVPKSWVEKSILKIDVRKKYNVNILAIKNGNAVRALPSADYILGEHEHLVVLGHSLDLEKLLKKMD